MLISKSQVLDWKYNASYPFYLIPVNLVELVLGGQVSSSTIVKMICFQMELIKKNQKYMFSFLGINILEISGCSDDP